MTDAAPPDALPFVSKAEAASGRFFDLRGEVAQWAFRNRSEISCLHGPVGCGKAQPLESIVWTPDGSKAMGEIRAGDVVLTPDGGTAKVISIHPQGMKPTYRVTFNTGEIVEATGDHLWTVHYHGGGKRKGKKVRVMKATLTTDQIAAKLTIGQSHPQPKYWVPKVEPVAFREQPCPIPAYSVGVILGDGNVKSSGRVDITSADEEIFQAVGRDMGSDCRFVKRDKITRSLLGLRRLRTGRSPAKRGYVSRTISGRWMARARIPGGGAKYLGYFNSQREASEAVELNTMPTHGPQDEQSGLPPNLRRLGIAGCRAWEKFVPNIYKFNSKNVRLSVLQGLMDTDGTVERISGMPSFTTTSRQLADDVAFLVRSIGGACSITDKEPTYRYSGEKRKGRKAYTCWIRYDNGPELFRLERKKSIARFRTKYPVRKFISDIELIGEKPCQCISIDHPDRLYLTDGFIPTHNTIIWLEVLNACALKYPGMRGAIMRKYRRWLTSAALVSFENKVLTGRELIPDRIQPANRSAYRYHNGSVIDVVGLDDPQNVMSSEYDLIYLQEATECSWSTIEDINGRLRYGRMPYQRLVLDCNPKGPKHAIKKAMDAGIVEGRAMRHRDNPWIYNPDGTLTKNGEAYLKRLEKYTGVKYRRNVLGEWVQADGVVFDRWDSSTGVVSRDQLNNSERFRNHHLWRRIWSVDFGYSHPFVWQDWAIDEDGNMLLIKEIYKTGIIVEDAARMILEVTAGEPKPFAIVCDHDREDRATLERHLGMPTIPAIKDVQVGIDAVQSRMTPAGNGRPRLMIYEHSLVHSPDEALDDRASSTVGSFDAYVWKKNIDGTITKDEVVKEDDCGADACRYAVMHLDHRHAEPDAGNYSAPPTDTTMHDIFGSTEAIRWV